MTSTGGSLRWLNLLTVYVVWGSTYLAIRVAVRTIPPFLSAGSRFLTAALLVGAFLAISRGVSALRINARELAGCTFVGGMLLVGGNGLVVLAEQHIASGLAALVIAAVPLWIVLFRSLPGARPRRATVRVVVIGFGGFALLLAPGGGSPRIIGILTV